MVGDQFIQTELISTKIFALSDGYPTLGIDKSKLEHRVRYLARLVNMFPELENQSLLIKRQIFRGRVCVYV